MKRLYCVKTPQGAVAQIKLGKKTEPAYAETKHAAKEMRRMYNGIDGEGFEVLANGYRVGLGPDHKDYRDRPVFKSHIGSKDARR